MSDQQPESSKGWNVAVVIAIIGLVGTLGAAVIGSIDKLFEPAAKHPKDMGPLELRTNRDGSDFSPNPERTESPEACARLCGETVNCKAMTFVSSPNNLPGGSCWLKEAVPAPSHRDDMTSAVKVGA